MYAALATVNLHLASTEGKAFNRHKYEAFNRYVHRRSKVLNRISSQQKHRDVRL